MKIVIIGTGYVGLPLAIAFAKYSEIICYDTNLDRIAELQNGFDSNMQHSKKEIKLKKLFFTSDQKLLKSMDIYIIAVPTPIDSSNHPDVKMLEKASMLIGKYMGRWPLVFTFQQGASSSCSRGAACIQGRAQSCQE